MIRTDWDRQEHVAWSKELHRKIVTELNGRQISGLSENQHLQFTCASLANTREHAMATTLLIECSCDSSALALQRVCFEAVVRSLWLYELATPKWTDNPENDQKRLKYLKDAAKDEFPKIYQMLECMETASFLNVFKEQHLKEWNSYTHGGTRQLVGQLSEEGLQVNYEDAEIKQAITFSIGRTVLTSALTLSKLETRQQDGEALPGSAMVSLKRPYLQPTSA